MADETEPKIALGHSTSMLAAMAPGAGDLTYGTQAWVDEANGVFTRLSEPYAEQLADTPRHTVCIVAHNAPRYLGVGNKLAWHFTFADGKVSAAAGELDAHECDVKAEADHSMLSNLLRIPTQGVDPQLAAHARARFTKLTQWKNHGEGSKSLVQHAIHTKFVDQMAPRIMPRFVFMTPEWVSSARHVLTSRAQSEKYRDLLKDVAFTFSEEFTDTPRYAFPDGAHGGFWVRVDHGVIEVGAGPLPAAHAPAHYKTLGKYTPVVPVGRTVNVALTEADRAALAEYSKEAFARDRDTGDLPVNTTMDKDRPMPPDLARVFAVLHDELSKRTAGDLPSDYDDTIKREWAAPQSFDRDPAYDPSWLMYDKFDIYGEPR